MTSSFRHDERDRTILFGAGALGRVAEHLASGYTLLTTARAVRAAPTLAMGAASVVHVPQGLVEEVAAALRPRVHGARLVALGGGRVMDVAKALAAADPPRTVVAVPTSLSAAEMTGVHRHASGVPEWTPHVRPAVVVNDPALSASQPEDGLAASSANALGHAVAATLGDPATPFSAAVGIEAIDRIVAGWSAASPDRPELALGALLAGWAVDAAGLGPHHAIAQTVVRTTGMGHGPANAAVLPGTIAALRARRPDELARLDARLGVELEEVARHLRGRAGVAGIPGLADQATLERAVGAVAARPELSRVTPPLDPGDVRAILVAAG